MTYYSEYGQDRWLVENVFGGAQNGTFVEAGALDGLLHSNTLHFEKYKNWRGVLIEPIPQLFPGLLANRHLSQCFSCALGSRPGTEELDVSWRTIGWTGFSRIRHQRRESTEEREKIAVPVRPLAEVLFESGISSVDYLSLDVEGAELEVLEPYPFEEVPIRVIGVEDNEGKNEDLRRLLSSRGYRHLARVGVDEFWSL